MTDRRSFEDKLAKAHEQLGAGRYAEAGQICDDLRAAHPDEPEILHVAGLVRFRLGDRDAGVDLLSRALELTPESADILANLGLMQQEMGNDESALACFAAVIDIAQDDLELRRHVGRLLLKRRDYAGAEAVCREALRLNPESGDLHNDLGFALRPQGKLDEALAAFTRASELKPGSRAAWNNRATLLVMFGQYRAAVEAHRKVLAIDPSVAAVTYLNMMAAMTYSDEFTAAERWALAREFEARCAASIYEKAPPAFTNKRDPARRLRVGYVSCDLFNHPVARNLEPILAHRDPDRFEIFCYADVSEPDSFTAHLRSLADGWRSTSTLGDEEIARQIRSDEIDVLVVLASRLDRNKPLVTAYRPAPVQISLFDTATSGLRSMDYLIADPVLVPRNTEEKFIERVARLPGLYAYSPMTDAPDLGARQAGPSSTVTIGLFHNPAKVTDDVLRVWARILQAVPHANVTVKYKDWFKSGGLQERFRSGLELDDSRLKFLTDDLSRREHLSLYRDVDLVLDPFPFSGATTTFEALWMGMPVVTLPGKSMTSRWSASILSVAKLTELIAQSADDYVAKSIALATDRDRLREYHGRLRERVAGSLLCDGERFTRHFERLLRALWRRWCRAG
jgi:protein O-GlcNAc transferase